MKSFWSLVVPFLIAGCALYQPPEVTTAMVPAARQPRVDLEILRRGRQLFANRCIQCHAIPVVWYYSQDEWPGIVDSMAHRAALKPHERDAIVAYIVAVRSADSGDRTRPRR